MISSSLHKNRGLRLQLLVGLLLMLGTYPEPSDGLKCYYNCKGTDCTHFRTCDPDEGYCYKWFSKLGNEVSGNDCYKNKNAQCFGEKFEGKSCVTETDSVKARDALREFNKCFNDGRPDKEQESIEFRACLCDTDYCNKEQDQCCSSGVRGPSTEGVDGTTGKGGDASGGKGRHSTSVLIFAILTVPLHNYT